MTESARVSALWQYPLKSATGMSMAALSIAPSGPPHDRRWMLIDDEGRFLTGRTLPALVGLRAQATSRGLRLSMLGQGEVALDLPAADAERVEATVWKDTVRAQHVDRAADAWLSRALGRSVRLVYIDDAALRTVDSAYARPGDRVGFADGYPLLALSEAALDALNARLTTGGRASVSMLRFRPNVVVAGCGAHAEDGWRRVRIGDVEFEAAKPCTRCVFTTVDPDTGERDADGEPLRTLTTYRRTPAGVTFGMNLIPRGVGTIRIGDAVVPLD